MYLLPFLAINAIFCAIFFDDGSWFRFKREIDRASQKLIAGGRN